MILLILHRYSVMEDRRRAGAEAHLLPLRRLSWKQDAGARGDTGAAGAAAAAGDGASGAAAAAAGGEQESIAHATTHHQQHAGLRAGRAVRGERRGLRHGEALREQLHQHAHQGQSRKVHQGRRRDYTQGGGLRGHVAEEPSGGVGRADLAAGQDRLAAEQVRGIPRVAAPTAGCCDTLQRQDRPPALRQSAVLERRPLRPRRPVAHRRPQPIGLHLRGLASLFAHGGDDPQGDARHRRLAGGRGRRDLLPGRLDGQRLRHQPGQALDVPGRQGAGPRRRAQTRSVHLRGRPLLREEARRVPRHRHSQRLQRQGRRARQDAGRRAAPRGGPRAGGGRAAADGLGDGGHDGPRRLRPPAADRRGVPRARHVAARGRGLGWRRPRLGQAPRAPRRRRARRQRHLEPPQAPRGAPAVLHPTGAAQTAAPGGPRLAGQLPLPAGQVLRHELRLRRQARAVRPQGGRPQVLAHVEGQGQRGPRAPRRPALPALAVLRRAGQAQARLAAAAGARVHQRLLQVRATVQEAPGGGGALEGAAQAGADRQGPNGQEGLDAHHLPAVARPAQLLQARAAELRPHRGGHAFLRRGDREIVGRSVKRA